mgnify:CR=1 FL=1
METHILRFEHPEYLYWLLVIPVLIAIYIFIRIVNKRQFKKFADNNDGEIRGLRIITDVYSLNCAAKIGIFYI